MQKYQVNLHHRYMILPINPNAKRKRIFLYKGETLLWDFDAPVDFLAPSYYTYMNVAHLMGKTVTVTSSPMMDMNFTFCDEIPTEAGTQEPYRPMVHFSARYGWTNDPNGLVYAGGYYHMFFQHNPADSAWGNMTWGHAISKDLIHWEQLDSALIPDELGTMFSGSGIVDKHNVSGLGSAENPPVLFYYTAAGGGSVLSAGKRATQCLAYSTDGGMTLHKYDGNPVIDHIIGGNRDPKAVWCEEKSCYLLALYLDADEYALFTSTDLLTFRELQRFPLRSDAECPDIYPLEVEGEPGNRKWIFSGASDYYMVGEFRTEKFTIVQESKPYSYNTDKRSYAAQTFSDIDGRRVKIAWNRFHAPNACFDSQMGIPTEVSLCHIGNEYRLRTVPCKEFESLRVTSTDYTVRSSAFTLPLERRAYDLSLTLDKASPDVVLRFFGYEFSIRPSMNTLVFEGGEMPLAYTGNEIHIRIISDTLGCEIFADDGLIYTVCAQTADYNIRYLTITPLDTKETPHVDMTVHELHSI